MIGHLICIDQLIHIDPIGVIDPIDPIDLPSPVYDIHVCLDFHYQQCRRFLVESALHYRAPYLEKLMLGKWQPHVNPTTSLNKIKVQRVDRMGSVTVTIHSKFPISFGNTFC